jgi:hypothetical protein
MIPDSAMRFRNCPRFGISEFRAGPYWGRPGSDSEIPKFRTGSLRGPRGTYSEIPKRPAERSSGTRTCGFAKCSWSRRPLRRPFRNFRIRATRPPLRASTEIRNFRIRAKVPPVRASAEFRNARKLKRATKHRSESRNKLVKKNPFR